MSPTLRRYGAENRLTFLLKISLGKTSVIISQSASFIRQQTCPKIRKSQECWDSAKWIKTAPPPPRKQDMHTRTEEHNINTHRQKLSTQTEMGCSFLRAHVSAKREPEDAHFMIRLHVKCLHLHKT